MGLFHDTSVTRRHARMNYLIDGHNLIGQMPDIALSDPDDEAKLVLKLLNWAAVGGNRRVIVVFDGGMPGQQWVNLRSSRVRTVFVPRGQSADQWLIRFMRRQVRNPQEFVLVTSDREIVRVARERRIGHQSADTFAARLTNDIAAILRTEHAGNGPDEPAPDEPVMPAHEIDAWLAAFGGEPELTVRPYEPVKPSAEPATESKTPDEASVPADPDDTLLSPAEVAAWLELFGGEPANTYAAADASKPPTASSSTRKRQKQRANPKAGLSQADVDLWHALYGDQKKGKD